MSARRWVVGHPANLDPAVLYTDGTGEYVMPAAERAKLFTDDPPEGRYLLPDAPEEE